MALRLVPLLFLAHVAPALGAAGEGAISGRVVFAGTPPARKTLAKASDPFCARSPELEESVVVGKGTGLKDVVVALPPGTRGQGKPLAAPVIDQTGCRYAPRVLVARRGAAVKVKNSDGTIHNIHAYDGDTTLFNEAQVQGSPPLSKQHEAAAGSIVKLKCDVHPWMEAFLYITDHAFARVTDAAGRFKLDRVPAGAYKLEAWHPVLGRRTADVVVRAGKTSVVNFTFGDTK